MRKALIIGAGGQIGTELSIRLAKEIGVQNVIASDIREIQFEENPLIRSVILNVLDKNSLQDFVIQNKISEIYHLAAALSANAEKNIEFSWNLNMQSLLNVLDIAKEGHLKKIFWPSSIAVFGNKSPKQNTPQDCIMNPSTVYGISKLAGEQWCEYYYTKFNVDVRSIRFPGLLGYKSEPGGGTTDYALWALKNAADRKPYVSFLNENTSLPMMHMEDAINGIIQLMEAPSENVKIRTSYNINSASFSPSELESQIRKTVPNFKLEYAPDFRQDIADSWPDSLDATLATEHWGWNSSYNFSDLVTNILEGFKKKAPEVTY